jgi:hypothetical protein
VTTDIHVQILKEADYQHWTQFVAASPDGSIYSLPEYLETLCRAAGGRFCVLAAYRGDEITGGIALYERDSRWGVFVSPRPLLFNNGFVLRSYDTKYPSEQTSRHLQALYAVGEALAALSYACLTVASRPSFIDARPLLAAGWTASLRYTYVVPLVDPGKLWSRVEQNLRRLVTRCEREGMVLAEDYDFDAFYHLHAGTMERKEQGTYLAEPAFRRYFETLRAANLCRLFHARLPGGQAVASQLVLLGPHPVCHVVAAATDAAFLRTGASAFLRWKSFEALSTMGFAGVDLTDAALNPVTHFKSQLGGDLQLFLQLDAPRSWRYRLGTGAGAAFRRTRAALASPARRLLQTRTARP